MERLLRGGRFETFDQVEGARVVDYLSQRSRTGIEIRLDNLQNADVRSLRMIGYRLKNNCYWF